MLRYHLCQSSLTNQVQCWIILLIHTHGFLSHTNHHMGRPGNLQLWQVRHLPLEVLVVKFPDIILHAPVSARAAQNCERVLHLVDVWGEHKVASQGRHGCNLIPSCASTKGREHLSVARGQAASARGKDVVSDAATGGVLTVVEGVCKAGPRPVGDIDHVGAAEAGVAAAEDHVG